MTKFLLLYPYVLAKYLVMSAGTPNTNKVMSTIPKEVIQGPVIMMAGDGVW